MELCRERLRFKKKYGTGEEKPVESKTQMSRTKKQKDLHNLEQQDTKKWDKSGKREAQTEWIWKEGVKTN